MAYEETPCMRCRQALSWYVAEQLPRDETLSVQQHLTTCADCSYELKQWHNISDAILSECQSYSTQPIIPYTRSWEAFQACLGTKANKSFSGHALILHMQRTLAARCEMTWDLVWPQLRLLRLEVWVMQCCILALAVVILFSPLSWSERIERMTYGTILLTAISTAFLPGSHRESAHELMVTLPTSARAIFLLRLGIVCCLALVVNSTVIIPFMLLGHAVASLSWFVSWWLAPLCCLVGITVFVTMLLRSMGATILILVLWLIRGLSFFPQFLHIVLVRQYEAFWHQPVPLFLIALLALGLAYSMANRREIYA